MYALRHLSQELQASLQSALMQDRMKSKHDAGEGGARVWNTQLLRYAGYRQDDMSILGDPSELQFTELCQRKFGWRPPGMPPSTLSECNDGHADNAHAGVTVQTDCH